VKNEKKQEQLYYECIMGQQLWSDRIANGLQCFNAAQCPWISGVSKITRWHLQA